MLNGVVACSCWGEPLSPLPPSSWCCSLCLDSRFMLITRESISEGNGIMLASFLLLGPDNNDEEDILRCRWTRGHAASSTESIPEAFSRRSFLRVSCRIPWLLFPLVVGTMRFFCHRWDWRCRSPSWDAENETTDEPESPSSGSKDEDWFKLTLNSSSLVRLMPQQAWSDCCHFSKKFGILSSWFRAPTEGWSSLSSSSTDEEGPNSNSNKYKFGKDDSFWTSLLPRSSW